MDGHANFFPPPEIICIGRANAKCKGTPTHVLCSSVSERERLDISASYYSNVTGELDKQLEALEMLKQSYPRDSSPRNNLALLYMNETCQYEKAVEEAREAVRRNPRSAAARSNLGAALMSLNRFDEAEEVLRRAVEGKVDSTGAHLNLYEMAVMKGDQEAAERELDWAARETKDHADFVWQAYVADYTGQRHKARELFERGKESAKGSGLKEGAAETDLNNVARDAQVGSCGQVRQRVADALAVVRNKNTLRLAGLALALCGEGGQALPLIEELREMYPKRTEVNEVVLPTMQAAVEISSGNPARAVELLKNVVPYELSQSLRPAYVRGLAHLRAGDGAGAAEAFQKILDHPSLSIRYALARVGLARAAALSGDVDRSRKAYEDFFALWKDADPDIPILRQARREYESLR